MQALRITPGDSVATLIEPVAAGQPVAFGDRTVVALGDIPRGH